MHDPELFPTDAEPTPESDSAASDEAVSMGSLLETAATATEDLPTEAVIAETSETPLETTPALPDAVVSVGSLLETATPATEEVQVDGISAETETSIEAEPSLQEVFEDITLAELVNQFVRAPFTTWRLLTQVLNNETTNLADETPAIPPRPYPPRRLTLETPTETNSTTSVETMLRLPAWVGDRRVLQVALYIAAAMLAWFGCVLFVRVEPQIGRSETLQLAGGVPYILLAMLLWIAGEWIGSPVNPRIWWRDLPLATKYRWALRAIPVILILLGVWWLADASDEGVIPENIDHILGMVLNGGALILAGMLIWLGLDAARWWANRQQEIEVQPDLTTQSSSRFVDWFMAISPLRGLLAVVAAYLSLMTWFGTGLNNLSTNVFYIWLSSIAAWWMVFAPPQWTFEFVPRRAFGLMGGLVLSVAVWLGLIPQEWAFFSLLAWLGGTALCMWALAPQTVSLQDSLMTQVDNLRAFRWTTERFIVIGLVVAILVLGSAFRLSRLNGSPLDNTAVPPEMTSDHVEKLLDSQRVLNGDRDIFFANNGGREPIQMYVMALFSQLPGQSMSHQSLKLLTALEGILGLPFLFWFGYEVFARENRRFGVIVGLLLMALVAVSYWHTSISRLALRIIYTPLITSLMLIYLVRGLRDNRTGDYLKAALCLGFGLYMYQAVRMLPVVLVVTVLIAFYFAAKNGRDRLRYILHLVMLAWVAFMIFLPMFHFSVQFPELFWRRTAGRLLGDDLIQVTAPDGKIYERYATIEERLDAFGKNIPVLLNNIRNAVLMFNWKGDIAWINGLPNQPVMDPATGAFFLLGLVAWGILLVRRRDVVYWVLPLTMLIMLLPSAFSIAYPNENPSLTRAIGALPVAYLLAAYPLALLVEKLWSVLPRYRMAGVIAFCAVVVIGAYSFNTYIYFVRFPEEYKHPSLPYSEAGDVLRGFAISDGSYGNAFMIAHQYWWDHRALGIAGGRIDWPNGIIALEDVPSFLYVAALKAPNDPYRLDPDRDLLFFYSVDATQTDARLKEWFPEGRAIRYPTYQSGDDFMLYRVPALGVDGLRVFFAAQNLSY